MEKEIKEILSGKPAVFENGVHVILFDLLLKHYYGTQLKLTNLINNNDELHQDFREAFPSDIDGKVGPNFITNWRAGKVKVPNTDSGRKKLEFFSERIFPDVEVHQLYNNDIISDYVPPMERVVRKCKYCKKPELIDAKDVHVSPNGQLYHRKCAREYCRQRKEDLKNGTNI